MEKTTLLIDNGHGQETRGKRSPDGLLQEWEWTRRCAAQMAKGASSLGLEAHLLVTETADVGLAERVRRANALVRRGRQTLLVSVHVNAAGSGSAWMTARGFSAWTAPGASATSRRLAALLVEEARAAGLGGNRAVPPCGHNEASFYLLRRTVMPAVLTENLFMDNQADCAQLLAPGSDELLAGVHLRAIMRLLGR